MLVHKTGKTNSLSLSLSLYLALPHYLQVSNYHFKHILFFTFPPDRKGHNRIKEKKTKKVEKKGGEREREKETERVRKKKKKQTNKKRLKQSIYNDSGVCAVSRTRERRVTHTQKKKTHATPVSRARQANSTSNTKNVIPCVWLSLLFTGDPLTHCRVLHTQ